jgi:hypothetical protein
VSGLWTPSGSDPDRPDPGPTGPVELGGPVDLDEAAAAAELERIRAEVTAVPAADVVANHVIGLWQLAVLHLDPGPGRAPQLAEAAVAIDAVRAIVDGLGDRLGENAAPLRDALTQLQLAYAEVHRRSDASDAGA